MRLAFIPRNTLHSTRPLADRAMARLFVDVLNNFSSNGNVEVFSGSLLKHFEASKYDFVFHMSRDFSFLRSLAANHGPHVVNRPQAVLTTLDRLDVYNRLVNRGLKAPLTVPSHLASDEESYMLKPRITIAHKELTSVPTVHQSRKVGRTVKLYGIGDQLLSLNGGIRDDLRRAMRDIRRLFGLDVYGADFILDERGDSWIVDVNDWPSFQGIPNLSSVLAIWLRSLFEC